MRKRKRKKRHTGGKGKKKEKKKTGRRESNSIPVKSWIAGEKEKKGGKRKLREGGRGKKIVALPSLNTYGRWREKKKEGKKVGKGENES